MKAQLRFWSLLLGGVICAALASPTLASTLPYSTNFGPGDDVLDFTTSNANGSFTLDTGAGKLNYSSATTAAANYLATEQVTNVNVAVGDGFVMETKFTLGGTAVTGGSDASVGLLALGDVANAASYYLADWRITQSTASGSPLGRIRIVGVGGLSLAVASATNIGVTPAEGDYVMRLSGLYQPSGALDLTLGIYDSTGATLLGSVNALTTTTPATGQFFGMRNRSGAQNQSTTASYDYLTINSPVVVPEPAASVLALIAFVVGAPHFGRRK